MWRSKYDEWSHPFIPRPTRRVPPTGGIFDEPKRRISINGAWWSHISGMIYPLTQEDAWQGTDEEIAAAIHQINLLLSANEEVEEVGVQDVRLRLGETLDDAYMLEKQIEDEWLPVENWAEFMSSFLAVSYRSSLDGIGIARALRNLEAYEGFSGEEGWPTSPLKGYIDAGDVPFDPSDLEAAIAAAQEDADSAIATNVTQAGQITAIQAVNSAQSADIDNLQMDMITAELDIDIAQADILTLDGRLDSAEGRLNNLDSGLAWSQIHDFTVDDYDYTPSFGSYSSGVGWVPTSTEIALEYPLSNFHNEITHLQVAIVTSGATTPEIRLGWLGTYLAAFKWNGNGNVSFAWLRVPNNQFDGLPKFRVITDSGTFVVKYARYLGRGDYNPFS